MAYSSFSSFSYCFILVQKIRDKFPEADGLYTGFKEKTADTS